MMNCANARRLIPAAVDAADLDPQFRELMAHIESCPACASAYGAQRQEMDALRESLHVAALSVAAPSDFAARVLASVPARSSASVSVDRLVGYTREVFDSIQRDRRKLAAFATASFVLATCAFGAVLRSAVEYTPTAQPRVSTNHLISFTVRPRRDGNVLAGIRSRTYCKISRDRGEVLK